MQDMQAEMWGGKTPGGNTKEDAEVVMQGGRGREEGRGALGQDKGEEETEETEEGDGNLELQLVTTGMLTYADVC